MPKYQNDLMLDAAFEWLRSNVTSMTVCSAEPTTYLEATDTFKLADVAMADTDLVISDGDATGRKVRMAAKTGVDVDVTGTATHVALVGSIGSILMLVSTCAEAALDDASTVDFPVWDDEIADAV